MTASHERKCTEKDFKEGLSFLDDAVSPSA